MSLQNIAPVPESRINVNLPFIDIQSLRIRDHAAAEFLSSRDPSEWPELVGGALTLGLHAVATADTSVNERLIDAKIDEMGKRLHEAVAATFTKATKQFEDTWQQRIDNGLSTKLDAHRASLDAAFKLLFDPTSTKGVSEQVRKVLDEYEKRVQQEITETQAKARREVAEVIRGGGDPDHPMTKILNELRGLTAAVTKELEASRNAVAGLKVLKSRPAAGFVYQDEVTTVVASCLKATGDEVEPMGRRPGATGGADGDAVITINKADASGIAARIAVEITQERNLTLDSLRKTILKANQDRDAARTIVVVRDCKALAGQPLVIFDSIGAVVLYDPESEAGSLALEVVLRVVRATVIAEVHRPSITRDDDRINDELQKIKVAIDAITKIRGNQVKAHALADDTTRLADDLRIAVLNALHAIDVALAA